VLDRSTFYLCIVCFDLYMPSCIRRFTPPLWLLRLPSNKQLRGSSSFSAGSGKIALADNALGDMSGSDSPGVVTY
jgi:hypothetical protein